MTVTVTVTAIVVMIATIDISRAAPTITTPSHQGLSKIPTEILAAANISVPLRATSHFVQINPLV